LPKDLKRVIQRMLLRVGLRRSRLIGFGAMLPVQGKRLVKHRVDARDGRLSPSEVS
jgi:hypothetical protein